MTFQNEKTASRAGETAEDQNEGHTFDGEAFGGNNEEPVPLMVAAFFAAARAEVERLGLDKRRYTLEEVKVMLCKLPHPGKWAGDFDGKTAAGGRLRQHVIYTHEALKGDSVESLPREDAIAAMEFIRERYGFPKSGCKKEVAKMSKEGYRSPISWIFDIFDNLDNGKLKSQMQHVAITAKAYDLKREATAAEFRPVGYALTGLQATYYARDCVTEGVVCSGKVSKEFLWKLAKYSTWKELYPSTGDKVDWDAACAYVSETIRRKGQVESGDFREVGAWVDAGRAVFFDGKCIHHGDTVTEVDDWKSSFIYTPSRAVLVNTADTATDDDLAALRKLTELIDTGKTQLEAKLNGALLCGWLMTAGVCGAIPFRASLWLTGGPGSGKTTILRDFLRPIMQTGIAFTGASTRAGIQQTLGSSARPVFNDEQEADTEVAAARNATILEYVRSGAIGDAGKTAKGTADGVARNTEARSVFAFASVIDGLQNQADLGRFIVIPVDSLPEAERRNRLPDIKACVRDLTEAKGRLLAHGIRHLETLLTNTATFQRIIGETAGFDCRAGQMYAGLLAGYQLTIGADVMTEEGAQALVDDLLTPQVERLRVGEERETDAGEGLDHLLHSLVSLERHDAPDVRAPLHHVIVQALKPCKLAKLSLGRIGLRVQDDKRLFVPHKNPELCKMFKGTRFEGRHNKVLRRIPGAEEAKVKIGGHTVRGIVLPVNLADPTEV